MEFSVDEFICKPSVEILQSRKISKADWIKLASYYEVVIKLYWRKIEVKNAVLRKLVNSKVLHDGALALCETEHGSEDMAVRLLELEMERERLKDREREREFQLTYLEKKAQLMGGVDDQKEHCFDLCKNVKLVPSLEENYPDQFLQQFETIANSLKWPIGYWPLLIQTALKGKGRSTYLSLSVSQRSDYTVVKEAILNCYELTAQAYRLKFRNSMKEPSQTFIEYAHVVRKLRDRWISASKVSTFDEVLELIALEHYLRRVGPEVRIYLCEKEVIELDRAAILAENYSLIHLPKKFQYAAKPVPSVPHGKSVSGQMNGNFNNPVKPESRFNGSQSAQKSNMQ